jgi:hypothetical protein
MLELVKPESEWERTESVIEDILRWADDGGQMLDAGNPIARSNPDMARERANERSMLEEKEAEYVRIPFANNSLDTTEG